MKITNEQAEKLYNYLLWSFDKRKMWALPSEDMILSILQEIEEANEPTHNIKYICKWCNMVIPKNKLSPMFNNYCSVATTMSQIDSTVVVQHDFKKFVEVVE